MATEVLKIVCAWCSKDMGEKDGKGVAGISHGMCGVCFAEMDEILADDKNKNKKSLLGHSRAVITSL